MILEWIMNLDQRTLLTLSHCLALAFFCFLIFANKQSMSESELKENRLGNWVVWIVVRYFIHVDVLLWWLWIESADNYVWFCICPQYAVVTCFACKNIGIIIVPFVLYFVCMLLILLQFYQSSVHVKLRYVHHNLRHCKWISWFVFL